MEIPDIGLGTYQLKAQQTYQSVRWALEIGYRHIDTAALYRNEVWVGKAVRDSGINRNLVMVTSKISAKDLRQERLANAIERALKALDLDYIDLLLLHAPNRNVGALWDCFIRLFQHQYKAFIHAIGVSNYQQIHLQQLITAKMKPAINQIEMSPFLPRQRLRKYCDTRGIKVVAHSSLTKGYQLTHPRLHTLLKKYFPNGEFTAASLLLKWALQQGVKVIPRSSQRTHIFENSHLPDICLSAEVLKQLDELKSGFATHPQHIHSSILSGISF